jgi:hypothetical protein
MALSIGLGVMRLYCSDCLRVKLGFDPSSLRDLGAIWTLGWFAGSFDFL